MNHTGRIVPPFRIALLTASTTLGVATPGWAKISNTSPSDGVTVTVDPSSPNPATNRIFSGGDGVTVNVKEAAVIDYTGTYAIGLDKNATINNAGTIQATGLYTILTGGNATVTNAGTIDGGFAAVYFRNGSDYATGEWLPSDDNLTLKPGSSIGGKVFAGVDVSPDTGADTGADTLTLGGDSGSDSFNVSDIGPSAQYQGFEKFTKKGQSTWTLTGTGDQNWTVAAGTLVGDTDSLQGNITNNATVEFNQTASGTYAGDISGDGSLIKTGSGTLTLTGKYVYDDDGSRPPETTIRDGLLDVSGGKIAPSGYSTTIYVGKQSGDIGDLRVSNGGEGTYSSLNIGTQTNAEGSVTITGKDSTWNSHVTTVVGNNGTGMLKIAGGGTLDTGNQSFIAAGTNSVGSATVTGDGSTWSNRKLTVGSGGTGTLTVADGGNVSADFRINIGSAFSSPGTGTVTVTGDGSTLEANGSTKPITVGYNGIGTLSIADGGLVSAKNGDKRVDVATKAGSKGTLNLGPAPGEDPTAPGTLNAAKVAFGNGTGTINFNHTDTSGDYTFAPKITGDGRVNVYSGTTTLTAENSYTGPTTVRDGTLKVVGGGIDHAGANMLVGSGKGDDGALRITGGGVVHDQSGFVGAFDADAAGAVKVEGGGSQWNHADNLYVGNFGQGKLTIKDGGLVSDTVGYVGAGADAKGTTNVDGADSAWTSSGDLYVGDAGNGILNVTDGGTVSNATGYIAAGADARGATYVRGAGSTWTSSGDLYVADKGTGTLTLTDDATVEVNGGNGTVHVASGSGSVGTLNIGAAQGNAAAASGTLDASEVAFGEGTGRINFNNNESNAYPFTPDITGDGSVHVHAGLVSLKGDNSYTGGTTVSGGLLSGNTNSLQGEITNNAVVVFFQLSNGTYAGDMDGTGELVVLNAGTITLTGNNTYSGGTKIVNGTLAVSSHENLGDPAGGLFLNDGTLRTTDDLTSARGVTLGGASAGGVKLPSGGDGAINTAGNEAELTGVISGPGALTKTGSGTLTLAGNNTYSGGTTVAGGTLVGDTDSIPGDITDNATVKFNQTQDGIYADKIRGNGSLTKTGSGTLTLNGRDTYTGLTTVAGGTLIVGGDAAHQSASIGGDVAVLGGAMLGGHGHIGGDVSVQNHGGVEPGNSIGTLAVTGDVAFKKGASYDVEIDGNGASDRINATGKATFDKDSNVRALVNAHGNLVNNGEQWTILSARGGVTDDGTNVVNNFAGYNFKKTLSKSGNDFLLTAVADALAPSQTNPMAERVARALDADAASGHASAGLDSFITRTRNLSVNQAGRMLEATTPRETAASQLVQHRVTRHYHRTLFDHLRSERIGMSGLASQTAGQAAGLSQPAGGRLALASAAASDPRTLGLFLAQAQREVSNRPTPSLAVNASANAASSRLGGFAAFYGVYDNRDPHGDDLGLRSQSFAGQLGLDYQLNDQWLGGVSFSYVRGNINFDDVNGFNRGGNDVNTYRVGPYVGFDDGPWFADASLTYALHRNHLQRFVPATGDRFQADYDSQDVAAILGGGYDFHLAKWTITPRASVQYVHTWAGQYDESRNSGPGGGGGGLAVDSEDFDSLRSTLGVSVSRVFEVAGMQVMPHGDVGWGHQYLNTAQDVTARFVGGSTPFTISTAGSGDEDSIYYGGGVTALIAANVSLNLGYQGETFDHGQTNSLRAAVRMNF